MAFKVPVKEPVVQNVGAAPIQENRQFASANAFGAGVGQALEGAGGQLRQSANQMSAIALEYQDKKNVAEATARYKEFSDNWREQSSLFQSRKGLDADGITKEATDAFDQTVVKYSEDLNDGAAERFLALANGKRDGSLNGLSRYEAAQANEALKNQMGALAQTAVSDIIADPMDPENVQRNRVILDTAIRKQFEGQSEEAIESALKTSYTIMHNSIIDEIAIASPDKAKEYFEAHKDEITGEQQVKIEQKLQIASDIHMAQKYADDADEMGLSETEALKKARSELSGTAENAAVTTIKQRYAEKDAAKLRAERQAEDDAWKIISDGGSVSSLSPTQLQSLDPRTLSSMTAFELRRAKQGSGYAMVTDPEVYNKIHQLYMDDKVAFAGNGENGLNLNQYRTSMTEADYTYWLGQQRSIDKAGEKAKSKNTSYTLADRLAKEYMTAGGIDYGKNSKGEDPKKAQMIYSLTRQIVDDAYDEGRVPTRTELEKALTELFLTGQVEGSGWFWDNDHTFFEVANTPEAKNFYLDDTEDQLAEIEKVTGVPQQYIQEIVKLLEKQKYPVTPTNIQKLYQAGLE